MDGAAAWWCSGAGWVVLWGRAGRGGGAARPSVRWCMQAGMTPYGEVWRYLVLLFGLIPQQEASIPLRQLSQLLTVLDDKQVPDEGNC
ncbi:hypothetical protein E2C01_026543 [Portunus trituberculatus]|uniref:Uncharacterized protein n=1 Tax=Portunus trituberculatus TaxID=210409 RepID=A0A5B7EJ56_PORTR|nr:hypothetical protein [Portunus trituberculatus]